MHDLAHQSASGDHAVTLTEVAKSLLVLPTLLLLRPDHQEIEDREGKTINEIFSKKGEKYFREVEKNIIREIVSRDEEIILSLGGGAFMNEETRKILKEKAITIWLHATIDEILHRVGNKNNRPLLNQKNKRETLEELAKKRYPVYQEADFNFDTTNENHEILIDKILGKINAK